MTYDTYSVIHLGPQFLGPQSAYQKGRRGERPPELGELPQRHAAVRVPFPLRRKLRNCSIWEEELNENTYFTQSNEIHEISWNVSLLTNFLDSGGRETLMFLKKNNDLCPGPPKDLLLAQFPSNSWKSSFFLFRTEHGRKVRRSDFLWFLWFPVGSHPAGTYGFACNYNGLGSSRVSWREGGCVFHFS